VHRALLTGLLSNVGSKAVEGFEYNGGRAARFSIFPGSGLFKKNPKWVMAAEVVQTTRLYARTVAKVQPQWIEQVGRPPGEADVYRAAVECREGAGGGVREGDAVRAGDRRQAPGALRADRPETVAGVVHPPRLVEGEFQTRARFFEHNQELRKEVEALEARSRERNLLAEAEKRFEFYDKRVPAEVHSAETFEAWRKDAERKNPGLLLMTIQDLLQEGSDAALIHAERFPRCSAWEPARMRCACR